MMHGMQPMPYGMVQMQPQMVPMPMGGGAPRNQGPRQAFQPHYSRPPKRDIPTGPPVTVFVGNITERAPDAMVRHLLTTCGPVISWKRVQGATGKLQAFGFCEYSNPDAGLRSIRLLHNWTIADKTLVVKVDAKTQKVLDGYKADRLKKMGGKSPAADTPDNDDYLDEDMKYEDGLARDRIAQILQDHSKEIESYVPKDVKTVLPVQQEKPGATTLLQRMGTRDEGLDGVDIEDEKKGIIHREIDKFRETMKLREAEKEEKEAKDLEKDSERESSRSGRENRGSRGREGRDREERRGERSSRRTRSKSREREMWRESERGHSQRGSERDRSRRKSPSKSRSPPPRVVRRESPRRSRNRSRSPSSKPVRFDRDRASPNSRTQSKSQRELYKEREMEDEEKETKKAERKARDKEMNYQERLRAWEVRESKKAKDYEKEKAKEKKRSDEQEREAKKLKEFLEDYDDERDDPKFYKSRELARRQSDREREKTKDEEDRRKEVEEMEALKAQIYADPSNKDPGAEFQRQVQERERQYLSHGGNKERVEEEVEAKQEPEDEVIQIEEIRNPSPQSDDHYDDNGADGGDYEPMQSPEISEIPEPESAPEPVPEAVPAPIPPTRQSMSKRKKLPVADIFNQEEEETTTHTKKKLKSGLPPITTDRKKEESSSKSADDKRKHIKSLIEKIPTDKAALFAFDIDWDLVDNQLMEKRIRPWVNKKIAEYIGEPEPTLTDFICSKVLAGSTPKAILEDVQMVLDEEAEVFVVKMWRLLIYEIENKKQKTAAGK